jgi:hypothetical protein
VPHRTQLAELLLRLPQEQDAAFQDRRRLVYFSTALMQKSLWPAGPAIEDSPRLMAAPSHRPSRSFILSAMRRAERRGVRR